MISRKMNISPKVIIDIDGSLTDYNKFIKKYAIPYFENRYGMYVVNAEALEIEDIFDFKGFYEKKGYDASRIEIEQTKILNSFWISYRFLLFSLFGRLRKGTAPFIRRLKREGFDVEIHTSRGKTCDHSIIGVIARVCTILQLWLNGVFIRSNKVIFYLNDDLKIQKIKEEKPVFVIDDKPEIIKDISACNIRVLCLDGWHNRKSNYNTKKVVITSDFNSVTIWKKLEMMFGRKNWECVVDEANSSKFFKKLLFAEHILKYKYKPIVIGFDNFLETKCGPVIIAPNHIRTIDPLIIESIIKKNVHWVALKRFFEGQDSIFNNSKNRILCTITKRLFEKLHYFPIERKMDNENVNNLDAVKDMNLFLNNGFAIGIFPEATTRKKDGCFFGDFNTTFVKLAVRNNARIQPVLLYWLGKKSKHRVIVNFGKPILADRDRNVEEIFSEYMRTQRKCFLECETYVK